MVKEHFTQAKSAKRGLLLGLGAIALLSVMLLVAFSSAVSSVEAAGPARNRLPLTPVATRTASPTQVSQQTAITTLTSWDSQVLGVTPILSEAKGLTNRVLATYEIPTEQKGIITANINASRAAFGGKVEGGGYNILLLGGGSSLSNESLEVQISRASLGYLQLPATTYPTSSEAALAQLTQAFPNLSGYSFTAVPSQRGNQNAYAFYATKTVTTSGTPSTTVDRAVATGVVKLGDHIWVFALVGTGSFSTSIPTN